MVLNRWTARVFFYYIPSKLTQEHPQCPADANPRSSTVDAIFAPLSTQVGLNLSYCPSQPMVAICDGCWAKKGPMRRPWVVPALRLQFGGYARFDYDRLVQPWSGC